MSRSLKCLAVASSDGCCHCNEGLTFDVAAVAALAGRNFVAISLVKDSGSDFVRSVRMSFQVTSFHLIGDCCSDLDFATPDSAQ